MTRYFECTRCGKRTSEREILIIEDDEWICKACEEAEWRAWSAQFKSAFGQCQG